MLISDNAYCIVLAVEGVFYRGKSLPVEVDASVVLQRATSPSSRSVDGIVGFSNVLQGILDLLKVSAI